MILQIKKEGNFSYLYFNESKITSKPKMLYFYGLLSRTFGKIASLANWIYAKVSLKQMPHPPGIPHWGPFYYVDYIRQPGLLNLKRIGKALLPFLEA